MTDVFELYIIQIPKAKRIIEKETNNKLAQWMLFLNDSDEKEKNLWMKIEKNKKQWMSWKKWVKTKNYGNTSAKKENEMNNLRSNI